MAFVRIWSETNFLGTSTDLSVGPVDAPYTIKSIEIAPYYCITVFEGATYTGNFNTYFKNVVDSTWFSAIKSIIVQDCLVPYLNDNTQIVENEQIGKISLSTYPNLLTESTGYEAQVIDIFKNKSDYTLSPALTNIKSIKIPPGFFCQFFDNNQQSIIFYNSVYFLDAFKEYQTNRFSSSSSLVSMKVLMKNPPYPTCTTCQTVPTCYFPCSDILNSMNIVFILGVVFAAVFIVIAFFSFNKNKEINIDTGSLLSF